MFLLLVEVDEFFDLEFELRGWVVRWIWEFGNWLVEYRVVNFCVVIFFVVVFFVDIIMFVGVVGWEILLFVVVLKLLFWVDCWVVRLELVLKKVVMVVVDRFDGK